jgi:hypothetical protein
VIWADAERIVQVLVNLLSNAVKFSPPGGVVTISVALRDSWAEFRVADRGRGVPVSHQRTIFEPFRQVQRSDAREKGGTGLGLAICKAIVERHGGTIGVDSVEGAGSSFWFRIATSSQLFASLCEHPVMICGDRRGVFEEAIAEAGYAVLTALSDDEAWAMLQSTRVAAVLMKTDSSLLARLRGDATLRCVPAILFGNPVMLEPEALSDALAFVLPRRSDSRELLVTIRDSLDRARAAEQVCADTKAPTS